MRWSLIKRRSPEAAAPPAPDVATLAVEPSVEAPPPAPAVISTRPSARTRPAPADLLGEIVAGSHLGAVEAVAAGRRVTGGAAAWAYAAFAPFEANGRVLIKAVISPKAGRLSLGLLNQARDEVSHEHEAVLENGRQVIRIPVEDAALYAGAIFRTYEDGTVAPDAVVERLTIEPMPFLDPFLESLWPVRGEDVSLNALYGWSREELEARLTGDRWLDNALTNKWEFVQGESRLTSFPTRFSVPFVLCNARCDFCSAWLANAEPMPADLIDGVKDALPYLSEIDLVGWGEPLIHPELEGILEKLRDYCDPRARISLTTNGVHLKKWADRLIEAGVSDISISIHAARPETHEDLMGLAKGAFAKVVEGMEAIAAHRAAGKKIRLSMTFIVTKQNLAEIPEFIALGERLKMDNLFFRTLKPQTMTEEDMQGLDYHRLPPYLHEDFEALREQAAAALQAAKVAVDAQPENWSAPIFPAETEAEIVARPLTPRAERRANKALRFDPPEDRPDMPKGEKIIVPLPDDPMQPAPETDPAEPEWMTGRDNPYGRSAPYRCPSPYTALYLSGFNRKVTPCCYMTHVPDYQPAFLRSGVDYHSELLNSPAMTELRRSLDEGDLKSPCLKCPFYW
jgi:molybdenum cofactor biosynthesis enzyme MoaA